MTRRLVIALLICGIIGVAHTAHATTQVRDRLSTGWWTHDVLGSDIPFEILYATNDHSFHGVSTACYRGFIAEWKIQDGRLYLVSAKDVLGKTLPLQTGTPLADQPVVASWFSGKLFSPKLLVLLLPTDLLGGIYFGYMVFEFKDGQLLSRRFRVEPIGAGILLVELTLLWLVARRIIRERREKVANRLAGTTTDPLFVYPFPLPP